MKKCRVCGIEKDESEYNKHPTTVGGLNHRCKACESEYKHKRYLLLKENQEWLEKERSRGREKYYRMGYMDELRDKLKDDNFRDLWNEKKRRSFKRNYAKYPEKYLAQCYNKGIDKTPGNILHHWNYNKEYRRDVIELTIREHSLIHRFLKYKKEFMFYASLDGVLLDTKEKHADYISMIISQNDKQ